jgi:hypothetical protein
MVPAWFLVGHETLTDADVFMLLEGEVMELVLQLFGESVGAVAPLIIGDEQVDDGFEAMDGHSA